MPTRPSLRISPMLAMPTTTVKKMMGPIIMRISLMKPIPSGSILPAVDGSHDAQHDSQQNSRQDAKIQRPIELLRRDFRRFHRGDLASHGEAPLWLGGLRGASHTDV